LYAGEKTICRETANVKRESPIIETCNLQSAIGNRQFAYAKGSGRASPKALPAAREQVGNPCPLRFREASAKQSRSVSEGGGNRQ
jgi:hypothetical protein